jgi:hypothetical protein
VVEGRETSGGLRATLARAAACIAAGSWSMSVVLSCCGEVVSRVRWRSHRLSLTRDDVQPAAHQTRDRLITGVVTVVRARRG